MKLIKTLNNCKTLLVQLASYDIFIKPLLSFCALSLIGGLVWFYAPLLEWHGHAPFAPVEKRLYCLIFLFLVWLLKLILLDLDIPSPFQQKDPLLRDKLIHLQNRFSFIQRYLQKTYLGEKENNQALNHLPWYLLIGADHAGKTHLLRNSGINFIKQQENFDDNHPASTDCEWWISRDHTIIDVPSTYLGFTEHSKKKLQAIEKTPPLWSFLLDLILKYRGKEGINGIVITLPLAEIMRQGDLTTYAHQIRILIQRLQEFEEKFKAPVPCYFAITKCDLLPGFNEFFAESQQTEIMQAWGILLQADEMDKLDAIFKRLNLLIKKLNQQLIWRLHQERNPMIRPHIKDFPLQVEKLKHHTLEIIKKFKAASHFLCQGIYFTSALQIPPEENTLDDHANESERSVQIFKEPLYRSRPYFIKQFLTQGLVPFQGDVPQSTKWQRIKIRTAYALSLILVSATAFILGKDFEVGMKHAYAIEASLSEYQLAIAHLTNPDEHLLKTLNLLNLLQHTSKKANFKLDLAHLSRFYSHRSLQRTTIIYHQALQSLLLPEIRDYVAEYLKNPINKNDVSLYAGLKSYLMLSDSSHYQPGFITNLLKEILPKSFSVNEKSQLINHLNFALNMNHADLILNQSLIAETRHYLLGKPSLQLSYIILKNINGNNSESEINLGTHSNVSPIFVTRQVSNLIPTMFTAKNFSTVITEEINKATSEAMNGNWVLGSTLKATQATNLLDDLRATYVNNYIDIWESLIANIEIIPPQNLAEADFMLQKLIGNDSPLLELLQTLNENTNFEPVSSGSPKLQNLIMLLNKYNKNENLLFAIFSSLQNLHQSLNQILTAKDPHKTAFEFASAHSLGKTMDSLTELRLVAQKTPEPVKNWLDQIATYTWRFIVKDASNYLNTAWQKEVHQFYRNEIMTRYPFNPNSTDQLQLREFTYFFGNPGIVMNFYHQYLAAFVDVSLSEWQVKKIDNEKLAISRDALQQIHYAVSIHEAFFPNHDNIFYLPKFNKWKKTLGINKVMYRDKDKFTYISANYSGLPGDGHNLGNRFNSIISMSLNQLHLPAVLINNKNE